jgi:tripartite-type tricarboxylate transporter receptor subunit TctC
MHQRPFQLVPNMAAQLQAGQVRPVAVMAAERLPTLPGVPTMAEAGFLQAVSAAWFGMLAPKGLPGAALLRLREEVAAAVAAPATRARLIGAGAEPAHLDAAPFAAFIEAEAEKWGGLVRRRGIQPD